VTETAVCIHATQYTAQIFIFVEKTKGYRWNCFNIPYYFQFKW